MDDHVGVGLCVQLLDLLALRQVVVGSARDGELPHPAFLELALHDGTQEACAAGKNDVARCPEIAHQGIVEDNHATMASPRVGLTLEQLWHRVPGGTGVAAVGMARSLAEAGVPVVGVAALHRRAPASDPGVPVKQLPLPRLALYESWHRLRRPHVERATGAVDIVHATSFAIPPRSVPLIVTIHDLAFLPYPEFFTARGVSFFMRGLELTERDADLIVCPSQATRDHCIKQGLDAAKLRVVPLGIDPALATPDRVAEVRGRYKLERDYVMWTGTIEPRKNLRTLIDAFAKADIDADLVLVGPEGWNEDLREPARAVADRIKILGYVPHEHLGPLYAGARAFCFPSLLEGFGFPVLEAMAQGTVVITSRGTSTEELAGDAALLVDPKDTEDIRRAIERAFVDDGVAEAARRKGPARAAQFPWSGTARGLIAAYEELV
jgi:glycosyltransferase involved in cell wall biosynthesis